MKPPDRMALMSFGRVLFEGNETERRLAGASLIAALAQALDDSAHALLLVRDLEKRLEALEPEEKPATILNYVPREALDD